MDYTQLVADKTTANSIKAWLNWDKAPSTDILTEAEAYIYSQLRVREMKHLATGQIDDGDQTYSMPSDFIASISFRRIGASAGKINILDSEHLESRNAIDADGNFIREVPTDCQIIGDPPIAYLNCEPNDNFPVRLVYWRRLPALSGSNLTNFLTVRYPKLLRLACIMEGYNFKKEYDLAAKEEQRVEGMIYKANSEYDLGEQANRTEMFSDNDD